MNLAVELPDGLIEQIAQRAAELVLERQAANVSPWLDTKGAAEYLAAPVSRIHDLVQLRKLTPHRDGRRLLFRPLTSTPTWRAVGDEQTDATADAPSAR